MTQVVETQSSLKKDLDAFIELHKDVDTLKMLFKDLRILKNKLASYSSFKDRYIHTSVNFRLDTTLTAIDRFLEKYRNMSEFCKAVADIRMPLWDVEYNAYELLKELLLDKYLAMRRNEEYATTNRIIEVVMKLINIVELMNSIAHHIKFILLYRLEADYSILEQL